MRTRIPFVFAVMLVAGCASTSQSEAPAVASRPVPKEKQPNWEEIDKSTQRTRERAQKKEEKQRPTTTESVESGFLPMTDEEYARVLSTASDEIRKANPKMSESDVDSAAHERAEKEKRDYERNYRTRTSTSYEWKKSLNP